MSTALRLLVGLTTGGLCTRLCPSRRLARRHLLLKWPLVDNVRVTPRRAFWEALATVFLPSLLVWTVLAYLLKSRLDLPYSEALPIYFFLAVLPMPLFFPVYLRYLKGPSNGAKELSPQVRIVCATMFAIVAIVQAMRLPDLLRRRTNLWESVLYVFMVATWLILSIDYFRRAFRRPPPPVQKPKDRARVGE